MKKKPSKFAYYALGIAGGVLPVAFLVLSAERPINMHRRSSTLLWLGLMLLSLVFLQLCANLGKKFSVRKNRK